jgi:hypothetical protein
VDEDTSIKPISQIFRLGDDDFAIIKIPPIVQGKNFKLAYTLSIKNKDLNPTDQIECFIENNCNCDDLTQCGCNDKCMIDNPCGTDCGAEGNPICPTLA